ncbi:MAG: flagellin [Zhongshania sp.]|uniref:flagellin N-terminal helical domain-containing protein n=1 Tax=Zhongshania sp. TaxID=1971902 RepID=UPI00261586CA|nr:flagellin [Zhongshania sp.]MDF1690900.1 flagellin [Zhongshania sp.]
MALSINTNVASLNAQRNLQKSQETLNTSLQRLSTGLRINSAKDDAAGLAISTRFTTQINGLNQAVRNANDGISLAQTGEAALDEITNNLQRIRELAVQSANATNSTSDRAALNAEVSQRLAEIDRIGGQTSFNGQKILDGTFGNAAFQVGANVGETINVNLSTGVKATQIGQIATGTSLQVLGRDTSAALTQGGLSITLGTGSATTVGASVAGTVTGGTNGGQAASSAFAKAAAINSSGIEGLTATATTTTDLAFTAVAATTGSYDLAINGTTIFSGASAGYTAQQTADAINQQAGTTGVRASNNAGVLTLTAEDGSNIEIVQTSGVDGEGFDDTDVQYDGTASDYSGTSATTHVYGGTLTLSAAENIVLSGETTAIGFDSADADVTITLDTTTLSSVGVDTVANSNDAIQRVDAALKTISSLRSDFGAVQNRFESTITNLQTISENLSASRGRILDADFAAETANLTKAQILQQAGTAILAQANALPQAALSLLQ